MLKQVQKAKTWFHIDVDQAAEALREPRDRIIRALDYLHERGWIELAAEGTRHQYQRLKTPPDLEALAGNLYERTLRREANEIARLRQVLELVEHPGCQVALLCRHFGEERPEPCGHCTWCRSGGEAVVLSQSGAETIDERVLAEARRLRQDHPETLADATLLARLLCGVTSPALTRAKLSSHPLFGALAHVPFGKVRQQLQ